MPTNIYDFTDLTLLHSERLKLYTILDFLNAIGLSCSYHNFWSEIIYSINNMFFVNVSRMKRMLIL